MNPSREELLFQLALTKPAGERDAWLERECGQDKTLYARLTAFLAADAQSEDLLAEAVSAAVATIKLEVPDAPDEAVGQTLGVVLKMKRRTVSRSSFVF